jgi:hypothetical protein
VLISGTSTRCAGRTATATVAATPPLAVRRMTQPRMTVSLVARVAVVRARKGLTRA